MTSKLRPTNYALRTNRGSTMLLGILMLATILSSVYALASITIRNTRQLFTTLAGEGAILAADAALERGLWSYQRNFYDFQGDCDQDPPVYQTVSLEVSFTDVVAYHCRTVLRPNPSTITLEGNESKEMYLIDQSNPSGPSNYSEVSFAWISGGGTIRICEWHIADCQTGPHLYSFVLSGAGSPSVAALSSPDDRYVVHYQADAQGFVFSAYGKDEGGGSKGLPADEVTIYGLGEDDFVTRQFEVKVAP